MRKLLRRGLSLGLVAGLVAVPASIPALAQDGTAADIAHRQSVLTKLSPSGEVDSSRVFTQLAVAGEGPVEVVLPNQSTRRLRDLGGLGRPGTDGDDVVYELDATPQGVHKRTVATNTADLPVSVEIEYRFDGEVIEDPADLRGRDGEMEVTYTLRNETVEATELDIVNTRQEPTTETIDVGVPMVGSVALPLDNRFVDVRADGANIAGDGRGNTVVNFSLVLFEPVGSFEQTVSWTADVTDAIVPETNVQVAPVDSDSFTSLPDAQSAYADTFVGLQQIADGAVRIDMTLVAILDGASQLLDGMNQLADGSGELAAGLQQATTGAGDLAAGTGEAHAGSGELAAGAGQAAAGSRELAAGAGDARRGAGELAGGLQEIASGAGQLAGGTGELRAGAGELSAGLGDLAAGAGALEGGAGDAAAGSEALAAGMGDLRAGVAELNRNAPGAAAGAAALLEGAKAVDGGLGVLLEGGEVQGPDGPVAYPGLGTIGAGAGELADGLCGFVELVPVLFPEDPLGIGDQIQDACDGARQLQQGVGGTQLIVSGIRDGVSAGDESLVGGLTELAAGLDLLVAGIGQLDAGAGELLAGSQELSGGLGALADGAGELATGAGAAARGSRDLAAGTGQLDTGANALASGTREAAAGGGQLAGGLGELEAGSGQLAAGVGEIAEGAGALSDGLAQIDTGANQLADGLVDAQDGSGELAEGMGDAADGGESLVDAMGELQEFGTERVVNDVSRAGMQPDRLLKQAQAADDRAKAGEGLTYGTADGADASAVYQFEIAGVGSDEGASTPVRAGAALLAFGAVGALGLGVRRRLI